MEKVERHDVTDGRAVLLYDEDCGFCRWSLAKILAWDREGRIRPVPLQSEEADRLLQWLRFRAAGPAIAELRTYAETIRTGELRRSAARLRDLTPEQIAAVDALTTGIVNKLMHGPTIAMRDAGARSSSRILRVVRPPRGRAV